MKICFQCFFLIQFFFVFTTQTLDFELIFSLQKYFESDVILLASKNNIESLELQKKLFKYKMNSPEAFTGVVDLSKKLEESLSVSQNSHFQNIMMVSEWEEEFVKKLVEVSNM